MNSSNTTSTESEVDEELVEIDSDVENAVEPTEIAQSTNANNTLSGIVVANDENSIVVTDQSVTVAQSHDSDVNNDEANNADAETDTNVSQTNGDTEVDTKDVLAPVNMDPDDESAISNLLDDQANDNSDSPADLIAEISLGCDETAEMKDGKIIVTRKLNDGLEMVYTYGEKSVPLAPSYTIKINDSISGNIPFKNNATKDRAYFVKIDDQFKEIKMASLLVNGLKILNDGENRKQPGLDKTFVKALIIGLCTQKAIENGEQIHKDLLIFMKGLYSFTNSIL